MAPPRLERPGYRQWDPSGAAAARLPTGNLRAYKAALIGPAVQMAVSRRSAVAVDETMPGPQENRRSQSDAALWLLRHRTRPLHEARPGEHDGEKIHRKPLTTGYE